MEAIVFALVAYFAWGSGDIFTTIAAKKLNPIATTFWSSIIRISLYTLAIPLFLKDIQHFTLFNVSIGLILGIFACAGYITFYQGTLKANPALVGAISGSWGAVSVILSFIVFHEVVKLEQYIPIVVIFIGVFLSSINLHELSSKQIMKESGVVYAFLSMGCYGIVAAFLKIPIREIGWFWSTYFLILPSIFLIFFLKSQKRGLKISTIKIGLPVLLGGALCTVLGETSYNVGIGKGLISLVAPIGGSYATLYVLLAFFIFRERITKQQAVGILTTLIGIVTLSFLSI